MAESSKTEKKLKYLEFVHESAIQAIVCLLSVYEYAKEKSGPLKPAINGVEGTMKSAIGPVYEKLHGVPFELILFLDCKVDKLAAKLDHHTPTLLKKACAMIHKAPEVARSLAGEVQQSGVIAVATRIVCDVFVQNELKVKELYAQYEPVVKQYAVAAWRSLNRLPLFPQMSEILVPTAAYCADKYNKSVQSAVSGGYDAAQYLPLIPIERIAKVFREEGENPAGDVGEDMPEPAAASVAE